MSWSSCPGGYLNSPSTPNAARADVRGRGSRLPTSRYQTGSLYRTTAVSQKFPGRRRILQEDGVVTPNADASARVSPLTTTYRLRLSLEERSDLATLQTSTARLAMRGYAVLYLY